MLENTFRHLSGFGALRERRLWARGIYDWNVYEELARSQLLLFSDGVAYSELEASRRALEAGDADFFARRLPKAEHYRIALAYPEQALFVDIETTGLSLYYDEITIIGLSLGGEYRFHVAGQPLRSVEDWFSSAKCVVTFNGTLFDLKFLRQEHPQLRIPSAHIDLRFLARAVGLTGGQKDIERAIGIERKGAGAGSGATAPLLWHEYRMGDTGALKRLIEYNRADVEGMKAILDAVVERLVEKHRAPPPRLRRRFSALSVDPVVWTKNGGPAGSSELHLPEFSGRRGPKVTYNELVSNAALAGPNVVGIDLTGSASRPSGWCLLRGAEALTARVGDDDEIIRQTLEAEPHLVSVDSPLSLPQGRTGIGNGSGSDDGGSIVRECERLLKRRGINVYPCLIPSMRALTERGIRLAAGLRAAGIPVIESYPGAAQDIMGIPRKRAGLTHLIRGLADFGIRGDFVDGGGVSHDEVDAITAAVVGTFFWCGRFEALGNEEEDYLIVPDLRVRCHPWRERRVVGVSGPTAAGKTTAATALRERGFAYARYSEVLADMLRKQGQQVDRRALQELGERINEDLGQRWLGKRLLSRVPADAQLIVVDGLRFPEDHAFFVERYGPNFLHLHVDAPPEVRKMRYLRMGRTGADFEQATSHPVEREVEALVDLAHARLENAGDLETFRACVLEAVIPAIHQQRMAG